MSEFTALQNGHCLLVILMVLVVLCVQDGSFNTNSVHPCARRCSNPPVPKICQYHFNIETYASMSKACFDCPVNKTDCLRPHCIPLNGVPRTLMTVNRLFPGPSIEVCEGDRIVVEVKNNLENGEATSIHWHGFDLRNEPFMDGVGMLTQCPIPALSGFTYSFNASSPGTHWWHGHTGAHRSDGIFGALTVRQAPDADANRNTYDEDLREHKMLVHDWLDDVVINKFISHHHSNGNNKPESVLINGKGKRQMYKNLLTNETVFTNREVYYVEPRKRYRFRMVSNAITNCPLKISIDQHNLTVIASDGLSVEPLETDLIVIYGGERYDFVIHANQPVGNYWVRVQGLADCKMVRELAILRYKGGLEENPQEMEELDRKGITLNPFNEKASDVNIPIVQLSSTDPNDVTSERADVTYYLGMDFNKINNNKFHEPEFYPISAVPRTHHLYSPQLNGVTFRFPSSPILSQYDDVVANGNDICTPESLEESKRNCTKEFCECTYVINVNIGQVVELVIVDEGKTFNASHPMHLHGHSFRVVALEKLSQMSSVEEVKTLDKAGNISRKLDRPVKKDTVIVPDGGFTIIRFLADNPGWWLFHCHLEFHVRVGMSMVIHAGNQSHLPPVPDRFPRCGTWPCHSCGSTLTGYIPRQNSEPTVKIQCQNNESKRTLPTKNSGRQTFHYLLNVILPLLWFNALWLM